MRAKTRLIALALCAMAVTSMIGCKSGEIYVPGDDGDGGGGDGGGGGGGGGGAQLNFFEEKLSGLWGRYHSYDGTTQYIYFEADLTNCHWEENSGSNARKKAGSHDKWSVDPTPIGDNKYRVSLPGHGLDFVFDYGNMVLYPEGYSNLKFYRSNDGKTCQ